MSTGGRKHNEDSKILRSDSDLDLIALDNLAENKNIPLTDDMYNKDPFLKSFILKRKKSKVDEPSTIGTHLLPNVNDCSEKKINDSGTSKKFPRFNLVEKKKKHQDTKPLYATNNGVKIIDEATYKKYSNEEIQKYKTNFHRTSMAELLDEEKIEEKFVQFSSQNNAFGFISGHYHSIGAYQLPQENDEDFFPKIDGSTDLEFGVESKKAGKYESLNIESKFLDFRVQNVDSNTISDDARNINMYLQNISTNATKIVQIFNRKSAAQIELLKLHYRQKFSKELVDQILSHSYGIMQYILFGVVCTKSQFDAYVMKYQSTLVLDEEIAAEILCTRTPEEIKEIIVSYNKYWGVDLVDDISKYVRNPLQTLLLGLCSCKRDNEKIIDVIYARNIAEEMIGNKIGAHPSPNHFIPILCSMSYNQLRIIWQQIRELTEDDTAPFLNKFKKSLYKRAIKTIMAYSSCKFSLYSNFLNKAIRYGDMKKIVRVIIHIPKNEISITLDEYENIFDSNFYDDLREIANDNHHPVYDLIMKIIGRDA